MWHKYGTRPTQNMIDDEEAAEQMFEEELAAWNEKRARIDAGLPLDGTTPLDGAAPAAPMPHPDDMPSHDDDVEGDVEGDMEGDGGDAVGGVRDGASAWGLQGGRASGDAADKSGATEEEEDIPVVLCTRCYSLRHYGYVGG